MEFIGSASGQEAGSQGGPPPLALQGASTTGGPDPEAGRREQPPAEEVGAGSAAAGGTAAGPSDRPEEGSPGPQPEVPGQQAGGNLLLSCLSLISSPSLGAAGVLGGSGRFGSCKPPHIGGPLKLGGTCTQADCSTVASLESRPAPCRGGSELGEAADLPVATEGGSIGRQC